MRIFDVLARFLVISLASICSVTDGQDFINQNGPNFINPNIPGGPNPLYPTFPTGGQSPLNPSIPINGNLPINPTVQYTGFPVVNYCYFYVYYQVYNYDRAISSGMIPPIYGSATNYTVAIPVNYTTPSAINVRFTATYYGSVYLPLQYIDRTNGVVIRFSKPMNSIYYIIACPPCAR